jgi:hypothetical protein
MFLQSKTLLNTCTRGKPVGVLPSSALRDGKPADILNGAPHTLITTAGEDYSRKSDERTGISKQAGIKASLVSYQV